MGFDFTDILTDAPADGLVPTLSGNSSEHADLLVVPSMSDDFQVPSLPNHQDPVVTLDKLTPMVSDDSSCMNAKPHPSQQ